MADFLEDEAEKTYSIVLSVARYASEHLARSTLTDLDLAGAVLTAIERDLGSQAWSSISPWEFVAAMPTIFRLCRQSGNATIWFEQVQAQAETIHSSDRPLTGDEVIRALLYGAHVTDGTGKDGLTNVFRQAAVSLAIQVLTSMLQNTDVSDAELVATMECAIGPPSGPVSQVLHEDLVPKAPQLAASIRKAAARAISTGFARNAAEADMIGLVGERVAGSLSPNVLEHPDMSELLGRLAASLVESLLPRLRASGGNAPAWCREFESHVDGGTWARPLRRNSPLR